MINFRQMALAATILVVPCFVTPASAQDRTITVIGDGSGSAAADYVTLTMSVSMQDVNATNLLMKQNAEVARLRKGLESNGILASRIKEQPYKLTPNFEYGINGPRLIGYRVETPLQVEVADMNSLPKTLDLATQSGATMINIGGPQTRSREAMERAAMKHAIAEARERAEMIAKEAGLTLGEVLSVAQVTEEGGGGGEEERERERERGRSAESGLSESVKLRVTFRAK